MAVVETCGVISAPFLEDSSTIYLSLHLSSLSSSFRDVFQSFLKERSEVAHETLKLTSFCKTPLPPLSLMNSIQTLSSKIKEEEEEEDQSISWGKLAMLLVGLYLFHALSTSPSLPLAPLIPFINFSIVIGGVYMTWKELGK